MNARVYRNALTAVIIGGIVLSAGWLAYQPALGGAFLLDDSANLGDLASIDDANSALHFVLSGSAGPVGRPLALLSFVPQADEWGQSARSFLTVNMAIHLLNAAFVGVFLYLLSRARHMVASDSRFVAVSAMALWLFMPLLASSTLMVVQRMTTMSATFVLLGLIGYLLARASIDSKPSTALLKMSLALVTATVLAVLTKESGALLPVLILILEGTLLSRPEILPRQTWRAWSAVCLVLPTAALIAYILTRLPYSEATALRSGFSGWERVLTEADILWEYLANALVPRPGKFGPFHDGYPVTRTLLNPATLAAVVGWLVVLILAVVQRRKYPLLAFAALWFVGGHLLESTTIPLELYFEHRNYVPLIGPAYALCSLVVQVPERYRNVAKTTLPLYILVNAFFLFTLTSLWGKPEQAAAYWHEHFPRSVRAATEVATWQLATDGPVATLATLRRIAARHPEQAYVRIPALNLSCVVEPEKDLSGEVAELSRQLSSVRFSFTPVTMLSELLTTVTSKSCRGLDVDSVRGLAKSLAKNPRYAGVGHYQVRHHQLMARAARHSGDVDATLGHLQQAIAYQPDTDLNMMVVTTMVSDNRFEEARAFIEQSYDRLPVHPLRRILWHLNLDELEAYVEAVELSVKNRPSSIGTGESGNADG